MFMAQFPNPRDTVEGASALSLMNLHIHGQRYRCSLLCSTREFLRFVHLLYHTHLTPCKCMARDVYVFVNRMDEVAPCLSTR